jgi:hypothetical protein
LGFVHPGWADQIPLQVYVGQPNRQGVNNLVPARAGKAVFVLSYAVQATGSVTAGFQDGAPTPEQRTPAWTLAAREGISRTAIPGGYLFSTDVGEGLDINLSQAVGVNVELQFVTF